MGFNRVTEKNKAGTVQRDLVVMCVKSVELIIGKMMTEIGDISKLINALYST